MPEHALLLEKFSTSGATHRFGSVRPADSEHPLLRVLPPSHTADRHHGDVDGRDLDELVRRLDGEPIAFSLTADRTWSAMSYSGDYSAHGDTFDEVLEELLAELPVVPA